MTRPFTYTPEQEAWLHDLETTKTKQAIGILHSRKGLKNSYCCLGRACVVLKVERTIEDKRIEYEGSDQVLSYAARDRLHLFSTNGHDKRSNSTLTELNDKGMSFKEIAKTVRSDPWNWFREDANGGPDDGF